MRALRALTAMSLMALTGCGYRFTAGGSPLPEEPAEVFAPLFTNLTPESGVEALFTQELRQQLGRVGKLGLPTSEAHIEGEVQSIHSAPMLESFGYRIHATARLRLRKGERVLAETVVSGGEDFLAGADVLLTESNRQAALRRLAATLMRDGYERLATGW